jgi:hypothetical protein
MIWYAGCFSKKNDHVELQEMRYAVDDYESRQLHVMPSLRKEHVSGRGLTGTFII